MGERLVGEERASHPDWKLLGPAESFTAVPPVPANLQEGEMTPAGHSVVTAGAEGWAGWPMAEARLPGQGEGAEATPGPSVLELEELLRAGKASCSRVDEVWPNLFIGDA